MPRLMAAVTVLVAAAGASAAAAPDLRTVSMPWTVVAEPPPSGVASVSKGDLVLKQRLLPIGYATLVADATDLKTGNLVAAAGTALLQLKTEAGIGYCVAAAPKTTALFRARPGSPYLRACFLDADGDGRFDSSAEYEGMAIGLPSVTAKWPKHMHVLTAPIAYQVRAPGEYAPAMYAGIKFDGFAKLGGAPVFVDVYGPEAEGFGITRAWPRDQDGTGSLAKTGDVLILGAKLKVISNDGTTLQMRVDQTMPAGPFGIWQSRGYFF